MKRKLLGILLVLVMCLPLVVPAFAEPAEEPAAPEETATLPVETETPAPEEAESEGTTWSWAASEEADQAISDQLARLVEEGELAVGETYVLDVEVKSGHFHVDGCTMTADPPDPEDIVVGEAYTLGVYYGHICFDDSCPDMPDPMWDGNAAAAQSEAGVCPVCGKDNWGPPTDQDPYTFEEVAGVDYHAECFLRIYVCKTANCNGVQPIPKVRYAPHSWPSNSTVSYSSNGADTHTVTHTYTCTKCDATKTETEDEDFPEEAAPPGDEIAPGETAPGEK